MPVTFLKNNKGQFEDITPASGINNKVGWWTSIASIDFDNDGDMDYIAGNLGLNSFYTASEKYPVSIYAKDFNSDGNYDAIPTLVLSNMALPTLSPKAIELSYSARGKFSLKLAYTPSS